MRPSTALLGNAYEPLRTEAAFVGAAEPSSCVCATLQALLDKVLRKFVETGPVALQGVRIPPAFAFATR
eukprot:COSAG02_NODE_40658_length_403_cov_0.342105_1_plen_68_part_10